jgi:predicted PurR-regulated permease PerM
VTSSSHATAADLDLIPPTPNDANAIAASNAAAAAEDAADEAAVAADAAEDAAESQAPLPFRARTRSLIAMLLAIVVLFTCYLARELIVPILLAIFLALCGNPIVAGLKKAYIPRGLSAFLLVVGALAALTYAATTLMVPAADWLRAAPAELRQHMPKFRELTRPLEEANRATESLQTMAQGGSPAPATVRVVAPSQTGIFTMLAAAPRTLASVLAVVILSFFFMVYGEDLLRRFITVVPGWRQKRITVDILRSIQADISRYMLTITMINIGLAGATGFALWAIGMDPYDAALWGALCGLLNFAPYVGPMFAAIALMLVGLIQFDTVPHALLAPAAFLALHLVEGQLVTPIILGRRMAISPVILMLWLFLWGWMWGIAGLLLAVPMLVCFKIYCSRIPTMKGWALMMEP